METDLQEYRKAWSSRREQQERERRELSVKAFSQAKIMSKKLKEEYDCGAVYLIGSLA